MSTEESGTCTPSTIHLGMVEDMTVSTEESGTCTPSTIHLGMVEDMTVSTEESGTCTPSTIHLGMVEDSVLRIWVSLMFLIFHILYVTILFHVTSFVLF